MQIFAFTGGAFSENTYLVACADGCTALLVDPGSATDQALEAARTKGLVIKAVLLTHAHLDHVEGVALAKLVTGAPIHLHPRERRVYDSAAAQAAHWGMQFDPPPPPDVDLVPGETLAFGGTELDVVFVPGHSPGHVMFVSAADRAAISGDVIFFGSIGRTDLPGGDYQLLMESIRSRVLTLPADTRLYPGHGPETIVDHEARVNPFLNPNLRGARA